MKRLHVLYDAECELCRRMRTWLARQPLFVPLVLMPFQSPEIAVRFPDIARLRPDEQMIVVSDTGDVWFGGHAWIMILWALREYREWSQRLANPLLLPFARRACAMLSDNRHRISRWLSHGTPEELRARLAALPADACGHTGYCKPR